MEYKEIFFSQHALQRMFERDIQTHDVRKIIETGKIIADYPDDEPFLSCLLLGFINKTPIHVVAAIDKANSTCHIVTTYIPDPKLWNEDFTKRQKS